MGGPGSRWREWDRPTEGARYWGFCWAFYINKKNEGENNFEGKNHELCCRERQGPGAEDGKEPRQDVVSTPPVRLCGKGNPRESQFPGPTVRVSGNQWESGRGWREKALRKTPGPPDRMVERWALSWCMVNPHFKH